MIATTVSPTFNFISSALRLVITLSIRLLPTRTTTCAITPPNCNSSILPVSLLRADIVIHRAYNPAQASVYPRHPIVILPALSEFAKGTPPHFAAIRSALSHVIPRPVACFPANRAEGSAFVFDFPPLHYQPLTRRILFSSPQHRASSFQDGKIPLAHQPRRLKAAA